MVRRQNTLTSADVCFLSFMCLVYLVIMCQRIPKAKRSPPYKVGTYVLLMQQCVVNHWLSNLGVELISSWLWRKELYNIFNCLFIASIS